MSRTTRFSMGPAALVAAAFIGPGTVVTASLAGANFGYALLWALVFSVLATMILQEMAARLGVVTQQGLGENIRAMATTPWLRWLLLSLIIAAVVIGNSVYQAGNLSGASMGLADLLPAATASISALPLVIGGVAASILASGSYRLVERVLIGLVVLMSIAFVGTFLLTNPNWSALLKGLLWPTLPTGSVLTVVALIGTTVVPYNLFLHASSAAQKWQHVEQLPAARRDLAISIPLGGLISIAIVATAAAAFFGQTIALESAADLGQALRPLFGDYAGYFMAMGLFAAGISSALTAPLASAYALSGVMGFKADLKSWPFRLTWFGILLVGVLIASSGIKPVQVIWFAQVANGLLLPLIAVFLLWACNQVRLGKHRNSVRQNLLGVVVVLVAVGLGMRSLASAFGLI